MRCKANRLSSVLIIHSIYFHNIKDFGEGQLAVCDLTKLVFFKNLPCYMGTWTEKCIFSIFPPPSFSNIS